jgi:hypothetical protein
MFDQKEYYRNNKDKFRKYRENNLDKIKAPHLSYFNTLMFPTLRQIPTDD